VISSYSDPEQLLVEQEHNMIIGEQYVPFIIPCKPTSPKVKVELIQEDGEVTVVSFNQTVGFTVESNLPVPNIVVYCQGSLNDSIISLSNYFSIAVRDRRFSSLKSSEIAI
jgi:hypothetical protein